MSTVIDFFHNTVPDQAPIPYGERIYGLSDAYIKIQDLGDGFKDQIGTIPEINITTNKYGRWGRACCAHRLDGSSTLINKTFSSSHPFYNAFQEDFTISFWYVNGDSQSSGYDNFCIFNNNGDWAIFVANTHFGWRGYLGPNYNMGISKTSDGWHFHLITCHNNSVVCYMDGIKKATVAFKKLNITQITLPSSYYTGRYDDFCFFKGCIKQYGENTIPIPTAYS